MTLHREDLERTRQEAESWLDPEQTTKPGATGRIARSVLALLQALKNAQDGWDNCAELLEASGADYQEANERADAAEVALEDTQRERNEHRAVNASVRVCADPEHWNEICADGPCLVCDIEAERAARDAALEREGELRQELYEAKRLIAEMATGEVTVSVEREPQRAPVELHTPPGSSSLGSVATDPSRSSIPESQEAVCENCNGAGNDDQRDGPCSACQGTGKS